MGNENPNDTSWKLVSLFAMASSAYNAVHGPEEIPVLKKEFSDFVIDKRQFLLRNIDGTTDSYKNSVMEQFNSLKEQWDKEIDNEKRFSQVEIILHCARADFHRLENRVVAMPD